jgi:hypothetical protein
MEDRTMTTTPTIQITRLDFQKYEVTCSACAEWLPLRYTPKSARSCARMHHVVEHDRKAIIRERDGSLYMNVDEAFNDAWAARWKREQDIRAELRAAYAADNND